MKRPTLKGPELRMPEVRVPGFLADLYYDLRDRRLLPFIALVVVAIAAVPFLLGGDVEKPVLPASGAGAAALESSGEKASHLTVVEATPGLRDYRRRLRHLQPSDPFEQQYAESASGSASSSSGEGSATSSTSSEESVTTESSSTVEVETGGSSGGGSSGGGSSGGGSSGGSGAGPGPAQGTRLIEFVFDVQISHMETTADGKQQMSEPEVRRRVKSLAQLPSKKVPVVTVAGLNLRNGNVWFLVSNEVRSLDGDFTCVTRTPAGVCELLEIEPGFPLELTYGPNKVLYRLKVTDIEAVSAGKVGDGSRSSRAAFGVSGDLSLPAGGGSVSEIANG